MITRYLLQNFEKIIVLDSRASSQDFVPKFWDYGTYSMLICSFCLFDFSIFFLVHVFLVGWKDKSLMFLLLFLKQFIWSYLISTMVSWRLEARTCPELNSGSCLRR